MSKDLMIGTTNVSELLLKKYKQLKDTGWVTLVQVPVESHLDVNSEALKILMTDMKYHCVYITLGKPCHELDKIYQKMGVDTTNLFFIDAISQMYGLSKTNTQKCVYTAGPLDIDSVTSSLRDLLSRLNPHKKCVFLDSITTVLLYNSLPRTMRFTQFLTKTLRELGITGIMVSVSKGTTTSRLVVELSKLCDEVLDVTTGGGH